MMDDVAVGGEDEVGGPVVAARLPDALRRFQFTFCRQRQQVDVVRGVEGTCEMRSGLIVQRQGAGVGGDLVGDLDAMLGDRGGVADGRDGRRPLAGLGADRAENVWRGGPLVVRRRRPAAAAGDLGLLTDSANRLCRSTIAEPRLYSLAAGGAWPDFRLLRWQGGFLMSQLPRGSGLDGADGPRVCDNQTGATPASAYRD